ncbi:SDR family oxidoreductase [Paenibacillus humicola]|uniref:SDR family oxidoreductase n=1 Tax=Paenibacillus humicola TaxID=3110540 RepID=UPI00237C2BF6|nr:SDR family oxidoreductase [Paenibacillus humicola]
MNILITGANRGLGFHMTAEALSRGHRVLAGVRNPATGAAKLDELKARFDGRLTVIGLDVADEQSIGRAASEAGAAADRLDAVVNSAAILAGRSRGLHTLQLEDLEASFRTNLFGPMLVMRAFLPLLLRGANQTVVNVSSEAGSFANAYGGDYPYALTKSALNMFSAQLRRELEPHGIRVYAVHPGWIKTDMGGDQAPGDAAESARGIVDLLEGKRQAEDNALFIDFRGRPMPL